MNATLQTPVLVLNRLWQAVHVCSVERALALLCTGHAQVVVAAADGECRTFSFRQWCDFSEAAAPEAEAEVVRTISLRIRVPRIILLLFFDRFPNKEVKFTRHNIFERDRNTCQYCGQKFDRKELNIDHVLPRMRGGLTNWTNVVCSCIDCNRRKGSRTPEEARMRLIRKPKKPRWRPFVEIQFAVAADHSWRHFLDLAYWNVELGAE
jgi:5-methylcytosine-specific restriction endonuclease McrA